MINLIKGFGTSSLLFAFFIAAASGMFLSYIHNTHKLKELQVEITKSQEENKKLKAETAELYKQIDTQTEKSRELSNELLQLSEEKTKCYKKVIKYNDKLKKTSITAPHRVEPLVNNYFNGMFNDVAKATGK